MKTYNFWRRSQYLLLLLIVPALLCAQPSYKQYDSQDARLSAIPVFIVNGSLYGSAFRPEQFSPLLKPFNLSLPTQNIVLGRELSYKFRSGFFPRGMEVGVQYGMVESEQKFIPVIRDSIGINVEDFVYWGMCIGYDVFQIHRFHLNVGGVIGGGSIAVSLGRNFDFDSTHSLSVAKQFSNANAKKIRDESNGIGFQQLHLRAEYYIPLQYMQRQPQRMLYDTSAYQTEPLRKLLTSINLGLQLSYRNYTYTNLRSEYPRDYLGNWCLMFVVGFAVGDD